VLDFEEDLKNFLIFYVVGVSRETKIELFLCYLYLRTRAKCNEAPSVTA